MLYMLLLKKIYKSKEDGEMNYTVKDHQDGFNRIKTANKENKEMALQIVNLIAEQNMSSCNAKIILSLCHDIIEINSRIEPIK